MKRNLLVCWVTNWGHFMARHKIVEKRFEQVSRSTVERMKLSRRQEKESDSFGLSVMRRAGFDPREFLNMLQLFESDDSTTYQEYVFRTHPFVPARIQRLKRDIDFRTLENNENLRVHEDEYREAIADILPIAVETEFEAGLLDQAEASLARLFELRPESGRGYYLKAELARLSESEGRSSAKAREAYQRAVELAPDDPQAVRALAFLYYEEGNEKQAIPLFEHYLQLRPDAADRKLINRYLGNSNMLEE